MAKRKFLFIMDEKTEKILKKKSRKLGISRASLIRLGIRKVK